LSFFLIDFSTTTKPTAKCDKCGNTKAYFLQIQIRSADEPMTLFFRCTKVGCHHQWREG
jgi:DNA-directed RNA polymerase III subunit RPC11